MSRILFLLVFFIACKFETPFHPINESKPPEKEVEFVRDIPLPDGFKRIDTSKNSFAGWLRNIKLKKDKQVHLYNGTLKKNQSVQFAVLDMPVGKKDLQQCADAVMRLRAEYLYAQKKINEIKFTDNANRVYLLTGKTDRAEFENYLENVFGWCGSVSLEKQLNPVNNIKDMLPGDVFIRGGFPGHAMIVTDVAINDKGDKIFILAQSYMPAQEIHIVKNPTDRELSPWYMVSDADKIYTPEWTFNKTQLRRW